MIYIVEYFVLIIFLYIEVDYLIFITFSYIKY